LRAPGRQKTYIKLGAAVGVDQLLDDRM